MSRRASYRHAVALLAALALAELMPVLEAFEKTWEHLHCDDEADANLLAAWTKAKKSL